MSTTLSGLLLIGFFCGFYAINAGMFMIRRNKQPIKARGFWVPFLQFSLCGWNYIVTALMFPPSTVPCGVNYWTSQLFIPVVGFPFLLRGFHLYTEYTWNSHIDFDHHNDDKNSVQSGSSGNTRLAGFTGAFFLRKYPKLRLLWVQVVICFLFQLVCFTISLVISIVYHDEVYDDYCDYAGPASLPSIYFQASLVIVSLALVIYLLYPVKDSYKIKLELTIGLCFSIPCFIVWAALRGNSNIPYPIQQVPVFIFILSCVANSLMMPWIMTYIYSRYYSYDPVNWKNSVFLEFIDDIPEYESASQSTNSATAIAAQSPRRQTMAKKYSTKTKTAMHENLNFSTLFRMVLAHNILSKSFERFTVISFCAESLAFYKRVNLYAASKNTEEALLREAINIQKMFLLDSSPQQVNVDDFVARRINESINQKNVTTDLFGDAQADVFDQLLKGVFPIWVNEYCKQTIMENNLKSLKELYDEYLQEEATSGPPPQDTYWSNHNFAMAKNSDNDSGTATLTLAGNKEAGTVALEMENVEMQQIR